MKVLMLNGSPHSKGNTATALNEMIPIFEAEGIDVELITVGNKVIRGCIGCGKCSELGKCVFDDIVNEISPKLEAADGMVVGSPVYYGSANATLVALLTRLFYSASFSLTMKVGAAVVATRRAGTTATFDELNKFFAISGMPIASGQYWNAVHGRAQGEAAQDIEGLQQMRTLARHMAFLMKSIQLGKQQFGIPEREPFTPFNFIR